MNEIDNKNQGDNISFKPFNNIIEEVKMLEQQMRDPNIKTFKKNINWSEKSINNINQNQEILLKDIYECLLRIETKLEALIK